MSGRRIGLAGGVAAIALATAFQAEAATPQEQEARIARLEALVAGLETRVEAAEGLAHENAELRAQGAELKQEVADLQTQVADLKTGTAAGIADVRAVATAVPVTLANGRPQIATADGGFKFAVRSVVQFDAAHYSVSPKLGPLTAGNDLASGTNFRRARLGFDATAFKDWNVSLWGEFGGSGGESAILNQAYVEYAGWRLQGLPDPVRFRIGAWATPTGLEDATSNTESLFLERPAPAELVRNYAGGDGRTGVGVFANGERWYASAVLTGKVVGVAATREFAQQSGYLARVAFSPLHGLDYDVHLGVNLQGVTDPADTGAGPLVVKSVQLRERPEIRVDATRLVDTGVIASSGLVAMGAELGASWKSFYGAGEWFRTRVNRPGLPDATFDGWYVQGAWTLTGERHAWAAGSGGFRGVKPAHKFDPENHTWGAFELAARYSDLDLDFHPGLAGAAAPAGGVRGGEQRITTVGLNWYPNSVIRFLLDYQWIDVERLNAAGAQIGERVHVISLRSQFAF